MVVAIPALVGGIVLLTVCAELAVGAAERLSERLGLSPVLIGALVVGLGTSLPELVVSGVAAAQRDTIDLAIGNIIGSNIANLSLVLGVGAVSTTISARHTVMRREVFLMLVATSLFAAFVIDNHLSRWEAGILLGGMVVAALIVAMSPENGHLAKHAEGENRALAPLIIRVVVGLGGVLVGAQLMVTGAVDIAEDLGASEAFIGLSIVALGTSLPELATTVVSARRGSLELVVGNVLGSNMFNSLAVGGVAGLAGTGVIEESVVLPILAMLAISVAVVARGMIKHTFTRAVGILLILSYLALLAVGV
ncbi:MAG: calcium/sodium antiporter [Acidimicrobiales bacterium]